MAFKKGDPNINTEGRKKGSQNNYTKLIKESMGLLLEDNLDNMTLWLTQVAADDPKSAMDLLIRLSERFVPKLSQQQLTDGAGQDLFKNIQFKFGEAEKEQDESGE